MCFFASIACTVCIVIISSRIMFIVKKTPNIFPFSNQMKISLRFIIIFPLNHWQMAEKWGRTWIMIVVWKSQSANCWFPLALCLSEGRKCAENQLITSLSKCFLLNRNKHVTVTPFRLNILSSKAPRIAARSKICLQNEKHNNCIK